MRKKENRRGREREKLIQTNFDIPTYRSLFSQKQSLPFSSESLKRKENARKFFLRRKNKIGGWGDERLAEE